MEVRVLSSAVSGMASRASPPGFVIFALRSCAQRIDVMASWPFWVLFLAMGAVALLAAQRLDEIEHRRGPPARDDGAPNRRGQT